MSVGDQRLPDIDGGIAVHHAHHLYEIASGVRSGHAYGPDMWRNEESAFRRSFQSPSARALGLWKVGPPARRAAAVAASLCSPLRADPWLELLAAAEIEAEFL
jgi:hypothetical protein